MDHAIGELYHFIRSNLVWSFQWAVAIIFFLSLNWIAFRYRSSLRLGAFFPKRADYLRELKFAVLTLILSFSVVYVIARLLGQAGWLKIYDNREEHGLFYYYLSFPLVLIAQDLYFYLTHVLLHRGWFYRNVHYAHHQSTTTNPLTGLCFHPIEGFIHFIFPTLFVLMIPTHTSVFLFLNFWIIISVTYFHSGFIYFPRWLMRGIWRKLFSNPLHHHLHHANSRGNYGLYFNYLDWLFGTQDPAYKERS
ncbi:MAG TPA: sterol desaturase family protein [Bdellovibrionales bacterium]|nr:sterol desaturase family protein [Bdellovibrionales bacterium]